MANEKIVIIGMGALMEKLAPCYQEFLGERIASDLIATTADEEDIARKKKLFPFPILLNNNKEALETLSPDIIVYAVPPQAAAAVAEADLAPFYKKCRDEGRKLPVLYVFPPRPAADFYLGLLGEDITLCHILPNAITSIAGKPLNGEGLNFITISDKSSWTETEKEALEKFMSPTGHCVYLLPGHVMAIMTTGVQVINYAWVMKTMAEGLKEAGIPATLNEISQACRHALEQYVELDLGENKADKPEIPEKVYEVCSRFTCRYYDGLIQCCLNMGLPRTTAKEFLDRYFDFYLHIYMAEEEETIWKLVATLSTKGGVGEKGEFVFRDQLKTRLFEEFAALEQKEPDPGFYDYVEAYVLDCFRQVLEHGANMGKKK